MFDSGIFYVYRLLESQPHCNDHLNENNYLMKMTMSQEELNQQIIDLQGRVSFQEDLLQSLNETVAEQDKAIQSLRSQLQRWESRLDDMSYSMESASGAASEVPPHY